MGFVSGILTGVDYRPAQEMGGPVTPEIVVLHDTASPLTKGSAANYLLKNTSGVSVHFVIERDGTIEQQVPVGVRANHAGKSSFNGRDWCNGFSVGIEIVNPGVMTWASDRKARAWWGKEYDAEDFGVQSVTTTQHGAGVWMSYTEAQIAAVVRLLQELFAAFDTLTDITTHWYISPGRKVDTNPLFPLEHVRALVLGHDDPADVAIKEEVEQAPDGELVQTNTPGDRLNLRRWPSFNPNVLAQIPHDTVVPVLRQGEFLGRKWLCVVYGGHEGWIVASYADPVAIQHTTA